MSTGLAHDRSTKTWCVPFGLVVATFFGALNGLCAGMGFFLGGLWLSPDLDTKSKCWNRWGLFRVIWLPYRKFIPHRSALSHSPFLGTTIRMSYLLAWWIVGLFILEFFYPGISTTNAKWLIKFLENHRSATIAAMAGVEGSSWLHLIKDGDPIPKKLKKFISK